MRDKLFCSTWANSTVSAVFFPTVFFLAELLQPPFIEHDVDCAFRIFHSYPLTIDYDYLVKSSE